MRSAIFISQPGHLPLNSRHTYAATNSITLLGYLQGILNLQTKWGLFSWSLNAVFFPSFRMWVYFSDCLDVKVTVIFEQESRDREAKMASSTSESTAETRCEPRQFNSRVYALHPYARLLLYLINPFACNLQLHMAPAWQISTIYLKGALLDQFRTTNSGSI